MAITLGNVTAGSESTGSSYTLSHNNNGDILFVGFFGDTTDTVTGVTYNGVSMTLIQKLGVGFGDRWLYLYYLLSPTTGANDLVVSFSASTVAQATCVSYSGAKQSGQPDASNSWNDLFVSSISHSLTTIADNCWVIMVAKVNAPATFTPGTGATGRSTTNLYFADSNGPVTPAGSYTMDVSASAGSVWASAMASFSPVPDVVVQRVKTSDNRTVLASSARIVKSP